jgi:hypothetical protein
VLCFLAITMPDFPAIELVLAIVSSLTALLGGAASSQLFARIATKFLKGRLAEQLSLSGSGNTGTDISLERMAQSLAAPSSDQHPKVARAMEHLLHRLKQAETLRRRNIIQSEIYSWSARSLTFSQYIVGGVLTLSFVKQTFTPQIIGVFGVIVFVASGLNQRFNPAANAEISSQKAEQLESLVHDTEDKIIILETTSDFSTDDPKPVLDLIKKVSTEMTKIKSLSKKRKRPVDA